MTILYGISNCHSVRKARQWLADNHILYIFHNFNRDNIDVSHINDWVNKVGSDKLLNRQGTTWRTLDPLDKARANSIDSLVRLLQQKTSLIKRPILEHNNHILIGFSAAAYAETFDK